MQMLRGSHQQLGTHPLKDSQGKIGCRAVIHGDDDNPAKNTAKENGNPLGAIFSPDHYAIALGDPLGVQVACEAPGHVQNYAVSKRFGAVSVALPAVALAAMRRVVLQEEFG